MFSIQSVNTNENLVNIIFAYLNVRDLAAASCVNKTFNKMSKGYNNYWRESCIDYFSSNRENNSIFKIKDYIINKDSEYKSNIEWKKLFKIGLQIKQNWLNISKEKKHIIPEIGEHLNYICNEIYSTLKDFSPSINLRKENLFVESPLNTNHQQNMYDFIYNQQDIYDYYDEIFDNKKNFFMTNIDVRRQDLPLSNALQNFDEILNNEFIDEKDMYCLANIRWYANNNYFDLDKSKNIFDENDIFSSIFSTTFTEKLMEDIQVRNNNNILSILNSIILTITFFCKINYSYIMKYSNHDNLFIDCFIKRYKAYIDAASFINEQLENLNVITNYLYETIFPDCPKNPKFSIYRLMLIIWNREVNSHLTDLKNEKNLINVYLKLFQKILINEVNKSYGYDVRTYRDKSAGQGFIKKNTIEYQTCFCDISIDIHSLYPCDNMLSLGLGNMVVSNNEIKNSILDDIYTFDFQAKYFVEQLSMIFLDNICNEYSVFYINDSQFPISHTYQIIENQIIQIIENFIQTCFRKTKKNELFNFFKNSELFNYKMINRTKKKIIEVVSTNIIQLCIDELTMIYEEYLNNNIFSKHDSIIFLKSFDFTREKENQLYKHFLDIAQKSNEDENIYEYATLYFIRELFRGKSHLYQTIEETTAWINECNEYFEKSDKQVRKENKRRNIHLDNDIYKDIFFNFTTSLSFQHLQEFQMDNNLKKSLDDDILMNDYDLPTFQETYDPMNFNMDYDMLELKRK